jgi:hypothetical protein
MPRFHLLGIVGLGIAASCAGPAAPPELPEATRPLALCLYNTLKEMPDVVAVDAFVQKIPRTRITTAVIGYWVRDRGGKPEMNTLDLSGPDASGRFIFSLDTAVPEYGYFQRANQLSAKCQADAAYNDPVLAFWPPLPPPQKVDMARYAD